MHERPSRLEVVRKCPLLSGLSEEQVGEIALQSRLTSAQRGEIIWTAGSTVSFFGAIDVGFVKMSRFANGHEITTELIGPGQIFGLLGAIDGHGCPQTAKAVVETWYLRIPKALGKDIYAHSTVLKERLLDTTIYRLRRSYDMIAYLSAGKVDQRIAVVIMTLAESYGVETADGIELSVPLTRQDIAEIAGTTVETTIRVISRWQKAGLVSTNSKIILIEDTKSLYKLAVGRLSLAYN